MDLTRITSEDLKKLSPNIIKSVIKKTLNTSTCVVGYIGKKKIKFTTKDY